MTAIAGEVFCGHFCRSWWAVRLSSRRSLRTTSGVSWPVIALRSRGCRGTQGERTNLCHRNCGHLW